MKSVVIGMGEKSAGIGILSGLVASLCCLGPLIIVLLGIGSFFGISGLCFVQYRPLFFVFGLLFLFAGLGIWLKKEEGTCDLEAASKNKKALALGFVVMLVTYFLILSFGIPFIKENFIQVSKCGINLH